MFANSKKETEIFDLKGHMVEIALKESEFYRMIANLQLRKAYDFSQGPFQIKGQYVEATGPMEAAEQALREKMRSGTLPRPIESGDMVVVVYDFNQAKPNGRMFRVEMASPLLMSSVDIDFDRMFGSDVDA